MILSHLTGRWVYIEKHLRRFKHIVHGEGAVEKMDVAAAAELAWDGVSRFTTEIEKRPLWIRLDMLSSSEVDVNLTLGSVALELIQKIETSQENVRVSREMEDLVSSVKSEIDESAIDVDTKNSLKGAVGSWGAANASERFRQLMIDYGVVDEGISGLPLQRMKFVSSMRNGIVHNGEIRKPVWIEDEEIQCQISYHYCSRLIPYLVVEYINRRLGLMGFNWPKQTVDLIRNYINTGLWYGEKIEEILE